MKINALIPALNNRVPFRLSESVKVPDKSGCYALTNITGDIIYIGQSGRLRQRMQQHLNTPRMTARTNIGLASSFYYGLWNSNKIVSIESQMLFNFKATECQLPTLNRAGP